MAWGKEETLYNWAFIAGKAIIQKYEILYGKDRDKVEKKMNTLLLTLRSELLPERFKRALLDAIIEANPQIGLHNVLKVERSWRVDEFYRYSTAILAGLFDALNSWRSPSKGDEQNA
jgi:hypothetical protein